MTSPPLTDADAEEMVATLKGATALHLLRKRGRITASELACELGCSLSAAYRTLQRLELSRRWALSYERPHWILELEDEIRVQREIESLD